MLIFKDFTFQAAHFLTKAPETYKCRQLHGHTYHLRVWVKGSPDAETGWVVEFSIVKQKVNAVLAQMDHACLNDLPELDNPTNEQVALWIWNRLKPTLQQLHKIELDESPGGGIVCGIGEL